MKYGIKTIDDFDVNGKTVLLRVDINQPVDKETNTLKDTTRIKGCVPTIKELSDKGAKLVILAHHGQRYRVPELLEPFAARKNHQRACRQRSAVRAGRVRTVCTEQDTAA